MKIIQAPCLRADTTSLAKGTSWISALLHPSATLLWCPLPPLSKALNSQITLMRTGLPMLLVAELQLSHW